MIMQLIGKLHEHVINLLFLIVTPIILLYGLSRKIKIKIGNNEVSINE